MDATLNISAKIKNPSRLVLQEEKSGEHKRYLDSYMDNDCWHKQICTDGC